MLSQQSELESNNFQVYKSSQEMVAGMDVKSCVYSVALNIAYLTEYKEIKI